MDLKQLKALGGFVVAPPVPIEVTWKHRDAATNEEHADTFTVHVRRLSVGWFDRVFNSTANDRSRTAVLISEGVLFGEDGKEQMQYEDAYRLDMGLATVLIDAFNRVNEREESRSPKA